MELKFEKYQGTGNDFVMVDDRSGLFPRDRKEIIGHLCDRKKGIGADGVILIASHSDYDFEMIYYNPDGSKSLCGNGSRCAVTFAQTLGIIQNETTFLTTDGVHHAFIENGIVNFSIHDISGITKQGDDLFINTGSPHHIQFVASVAEIDPITNGRVIRNSDRYAPNGTNVNFVEKLIDKIKVRTYERGVEDETLSCGTGVTACALAVGSMGFDSPVKVETLGGMLSVSFDRNGEDGFQNIYLAGPAEKVYEGRIELPI